MRKALSCADFRTIMERAARKGPDISYMPRGGVIRGWSGSGNEVLKATRSMRS